MNGPKLARLGRYLLLRPLSEGGMGALFLAYDPRRPTPIVLKRLGARTSPELRARLLDEMTITRRLVHPQLVEYLDAGEADDELYLALAYLPGRDLYALCARIWDGGARVPLPVALWIARQLGEALAYAHARPGLDFIHRDVTPTNVLIGYDGSVRLADHGLAWTSTKGFRTVPGVATGTLGFVSPEQLAAAPLDQRTDVYGLGAVLWFMLTGRPPADPLDPSRSLVAQRRLAHFAPGLPAKVEALVYRALEADRAQRYASAAALRDALVEAGAASADASSALAALVAEHFPGEAQRTESELAELLAQAKAQDAATPLRLPRSRALRGGSGIALLISLGLLGWHLRERTEPARTEAFGPTRPPLLEAPRTTPQPAAPSEAATAAAGHASGATAAHTLAPVARSRTDARLAEAQALARRGMMARASALYDELDRAGASPAQVSLGRAELAFLRGDHAEATRLATRSIEQGGGDPARQLLARARARAR